MAWQRTRTQLLELSASDVWGVLSDLRRWPRWCSAIHEAALDAELRLGVTGHYVPSKRWAATLHASTAARLRVIDVKERQRLVIEQRNPGGSMRVSWTLRETGEASCELTQRVTVTGPLTAAVVLGVANGLVRTWHESCARLHGLVPTAGSPSSLKVVIAGGSGSLGRALAADLTCRGHDVVILTRRVNPDLPYEQAEWDGVNQGPWTDELAEPTRTAVVNLAGRLVDARPTPRTIADLRGSRVLPTEALVLASQQRAAPLAAWVQASSTAIWSDAADERVTESTPLPNGAQALPQMTGVAEPWERAVGGARARRLVVLRSSIVLQNGAPAFNRLTSLVRAGFGGRIDTGQQWISWIHLDDWLAIVRAALGLDEAVTLPDGVVIASAPHPVRNVELMAALRHSLRRPPALPTPAPLVRLGAVLLGTDPALALTGRHCTSPLLADAGFEFAHPTLDGALADLLT